MESSDVSRAIDAAISIAVTLDLPADDAIILHNSNKLALRLLPCDVFAPSHLWAPNSLGSRSRSRNG